MNALIIGHSFVFKLKIYFQQKKFCREENLAEALRVSQTIDFVKLIGISGGLIQNCIAVTNKKAKEADVIILDIGSNDIDNGACPLEEATKLVSVAHDLVQHTKLKSVVFCSVLYRSPHRIHTQDFNKVLIFNKVLKAHCEVETNLSYHSHRGCWINPVPEWSIDELHPDPQRYEKSIRQARF